MNSESTKKIILSLILILGCFLLYFIYTNYIVKPTIITVSAEGSVKIQPTLVSYTVSVINTATDPVQALKVNKNLVAKAVDLLQKSGMPSENINLAYPQVISPAVIGSSYQAVNVISVAKSPIDRFEATVTDLYGLGVWSVENIVFTTEKSEDLEKQAIVLAISNVQKRAKELAKTTGKSLGRMVSVTTQEAGSAGALGGLSAQKDADMSKSLPAQIEIIRQASAIYELR